MSIPDDMILNYFNYATKVSPEEIEEIAKQLKEDSVNPKVIKQRLAREIVSLYHGSEIAKEEEVEFNSVFAKKELPDDMPEFVMTEPMKIIDILTASKTCASGGEARRMIKQNAVSIDGEKVKDIFAEIDKEVTIKVGKRRFLKVTQSS